jgi:hypothetical protein
MVKARTVSIETLAPAAPRQRKLSPRQRAALEREASIRKAIAKLKPGQVAVIEAEPNEKLPTVRLALKRVLADETFRGVNFAGRDGAFYVSRDSLPFARRGRRPKSA